MISGKKVLAAAMTVVMVMGITSCRQEAETVESVTETSGSTSESSENAIASFTPVEVTEDYDGPILGIENWHQENTPYVLLFINDDTEEVFASCTFKDSVYLADLNNDGEPELICVEKVGKNLSTSTTVYKVYDGVISLAGPAYGSVISGPKYYPEFAKANGLEVNKSNCDNYSDRFDPERNMIIVTDSSTGTEYELKWDDLVFFTRAEYDARIEEIVAAETEPKFDPSVDSEIEYTTAEPSVTDISDTEKKLVFYRDDTMLDGKLYLPDGEGTFPVIVLSSGLLQPYTDYEAKAKAFAEKGYAAVVFNFTTNIDGSAATTGEVMLSQVKDLYSVMDSLHALPGVDTDEIYLWGHSYGGLVSVYTGYRRQSEVKGLILVEPTIANDDYIIMQDEPLLSVHVFEMLKKTKLNAVIYMGTHDGFGDDPHAFTKAVIALPMSKLVTIDGADHFFEGEYGQKMVEDACKQIDSWNA